MKVSTELRNEIAAYKAATKWYQRGPLVRMVFLAAPAIPLIVIVLAMAAGMAVGDWIAMHCANGTMPSGLQWLCF